VRPMPTTVRLLLPPVGNGGHARTARYAELAPNDACVQAVLAGRVRNREVMGRHGDTGVAVLPEPVGMGRTKGTRT
jgi:hypothetical protein